VWPSLLGGIKTEDAAAEADGCNHRLSDASHRLNDSGIELISSASSSSASDSWLAQVSTFVLWTYFSWAVLKANARLAY